MLLCPEEEQNARARFWLVGHHQFRNSAISHIRTEDPPGCVSQFRMCMCASATEAAEPPYQATQARRATFQRETTSALGARPRVRQALSNMMQSVASDEPPPDTEVLGGCGNIKWCRRVSSWEAGQDRTAGRARTGAGGGCVVVSCRTLLVPKVGEKL